jgi:hypothetical protein
MADGAAVASRFGLDHHVVEELLLDYEAQGWVTRARFAGTGGWTLTAAGRAENERRLAAELEETTARPEIEAAHGEFLTLNSRFLTAVTNWQIRPERADPLAANDHTDWRWDERVLDDLHRLERQLRPVCQRLSESLERFSGYPERYSAGLDKVDQGQRSWVDQPRIDSCHTVWMELHEDLLATLGLERGS